MVKTMDIVPFKFFLILFLVAFTGCAGTWYGDVGLRKSKYTEKASDGSLESALSKSSGRTITVIEGDRDGYHTEGTGMQFSLAYETEFLVQFFRYYKLDYDSLHYVYSIDGSDTVASNIILKTSGFEYLLGMKLWLLHPRIVFRHNTAEITSISGSYSDSNFWVGYGIGTYYEVYNNWLIYVGYDRYFPVAMDPLFKINTVEYSVGVLYRFGSLGGGGGDTGRTSKFGNPFF